MNSKDDNKYPNEYINIKDPKIIDSLKLKIDDTKENLKSNPDFMRVKKLNKSLRSYSTFVNCPYCRHSALTKTKSNINFINLLFCIFTVIFGWAIVKCCRGKDFNCYNVEHSCFKCDNKLANYNAC